MKVVLGLKLYFMPRLNAKRFAPRLQRAEKGVKLCTLQSLRDRRSSGS